MRRALREFEPVELRQRGGVLAVLADAPVDQLVARARDVLGVNLVHPAIVVEKTPEAAVDAAVELLRGLEGRTFAIRARRRDKRFPIDSRELATLAGRAVQDAFGLDVDLTSPDLEVYLEVDKDEIFAYTEKLPGRGGLPVGTSGRAVVLLSGGIEPAGAPSPPRLGQGGDHPRG